MHPHFRFEKCIDKGMRVPPGDKALVLEEGSQGQAPSWGLWAQRLACRGEGLE